MVDIIIVAFAAWAAFRGWRNGFLGQVFELGLAFVGLLIGLRYALTGGDIRDDVARGSRRSRPVETGKCTN